ncbi:MAG: anthranilate phosphoribosyltransferase [Candidatus Sumerlaeaceae bacterium]
MNITSLTNRILAAEPVGGNEQEVEGAAMEMMSGEATPVQMAALLTAIAAREETPELLAAFARVLRARALPFRRPAGPLLDTCGTGGDSSGTFNISTAAAFVAAGAGVRVAKHGNRSMTSKCGSADVLAELGVRVDCDASVMERALEEIGICFLFAQCYHLSMKHVAPIRKELGFRTIFNLLGPLANPAGASHQLLGVAVPGKTRLLADVLSLLGTEHALVVHGSDGLDEITTTGPTFAYEIRGSNVHELTIQPQEYGISLADPTELRGGDASQNARMLERVLDGEPGADLDIVLLNAGAAIWVAGKAANLSDGIAAARKSIESDAAMHKLEQLVTLTSRAEQSGKP